MALARGPLPSRVAHLTQFLLFQLRAQAEKLLGNVAGFDSYMDSLSAPEEDAPATSDPLVSDLGSSTKDVAACWPLMEKFLATRAAGDKWVPWSTAAGEHERFIAERIYSLAHLSDEEKVQHAPLLSLLRGILPTSVSLNPPTFSCAVLASLCVSRIFVGTMLRIGTGTAFRVP